jgi:hypothetical protein
VPPCAGSSASGGSPSGVSQITSNWDTFFNSATPNLKRVQLLQNGSQFASHPRGRDRGPSGRHVEGRRRLLWPADPGQERWPVRPGALGMQLSQLSSPRGGSAGGRAVACDAGTPG